MEDQRPPFRLIDFAIVFDADNLPRRQTDQCSFLIVVMLTPVEQVAALHFFQKDGVEAENMTDVLHRMRFREIDHADQRMQGFDTQQVVVFEDVFDIVDSLFHSRFVFAWKRCCFRLPSGVCGSVACSKRRT